jgi:N-acetylneuraminic acid mutarotase
MAVGCLVPLLLVLCALPAQAFVPQWETTGSMVTARCACTATVLPDGKVLVAGGYNGSTPWTVYASAELYDPATGTWESTGSMSGSRAGHKAMLLPNGKVLVAGGYDGAYLTSAELYDPDTGTWTTTGSMAEGRVWHTMTLLPNGKVLVTGGENGSSTFSALTAELYDPAANGGLGAWSATGSMAQARSVHTATLLPDGKVLVAGGAVV